MEVVVRKEEHYMLAREKKVRRRDKKKREGGKQTRKRERVKTILLSPLVYCRVRQMCARAAESRMRLMPQQELHACLRHPLRSRGKQCPQPQEVERFPSLMSCEYWRLFMRNWTVLPSLPLLP